MTARIRYLATRLAMIGVVLLATLPNLNASLDMTAFSWRLHRALAPELQWGDAIDGLRNLALFAGVGVVWVVTSLGGKLRHQVRQATILGCSLSLGVEVAQLFSSARNASIVDVFTNTLGAFLGASAIAVLLAMLRHERNVKAYAGLPTLFIAGPYLIALLCEALTPLFHSEPIPALRGSPLARWHESLARAFPLSPAEIPVSDILLFCAGGFSLVMLLREHGVGSLRWLAAPLVAGALLIVAGHLTHGLYGLEMHPEAMVTDALSFALGALAAHRWLAPVGEERISARRARVMLVSLATLLLLWGWRPYALQVSQEYLTSQLSLSHFIPLRSLASRDDVFSAIHVAQQFFLYVPLGAVLAVWPLRRHGVWSYLWAAFAFAILVEAGHVVIADRMFDITNALLAIAGLEVGWVVVRRCGYTPYGEVLSPTA